MREYLGCCALLFTLISFAFAVWACTDFSERRRPWGTTTVHSTPSPCEDSSWRISGVTRNGRSVRCVELAGSSECVGSDARSHTSRVFYLRDYSLGGFGGFKWKCPVTCGLCTAGAHIRTPRKCTRTHVRMGACARARSHSDAFPDAFAHDQSRIQLAHPNAYSHRATHHTHADDTHANACADIRAQDIWPLHCRHPKHFRV